MAMFETFAKYLQDTSITNLSREYHNGVDDINIIPLTNVLESDEITALQKTFDMSYKTYEYDERSQCKIDMNNPLYAEFSKLIDIIDNKFGKETNHVDARIWHDEEGFYFWPHTDNSDIHISIQVYLDNNAPEYCGTSFFYNGLKKGDNFANIITPPYKTGSGYLLVNTNKEVHGMINKVPEGSSRTSLYLNFKKNR